MLFALVLSLTLSLSPHLFSHGQFNVSNSLTVLLYYRTKLALVLSLSLSPHLFSHGQFNVSNSLTVLLYYRTKLALVFSLTLSLSPHLFSHGQFNVSNSLTVLLYYRTNLASYYDISFPRRCPRALTVSLMSRTPLLYYYWGERERAPPWEFNAPPVCLSVCLSVYIYRTYVSFWPRGGPRATRKRSRPDRESIQSS